MEITKRQLTDAITSISKTSKTTHNSDISAARESFNKEKEERILSFSQVKWFNKPLLLNPIVLSQNGYRNTLPDTIVCDVCNNKVVCTMDASASTSSVFEYLLTLKKSHQTSCKFRDFTPVNNNISSFGKMKSDFLKRIVNLKRHSLLLRLKMPEFDFDVRMLHSITGSLLDCDSEGEVEHSFRHYNLIILALLGWDLDFTSSMPLLKCFLCFRKVGVWNFDLEKGTIDTTSEEASAPGNIFNPINEHNCYCPWVNLEPSTEDKLKYATFYQELLSSTHSADEIFQTNQQKSVSLKVNEASELMQRILNASSKRS